MESIQEIRDKIDAVDKKILKHLAFRLDLCRKIGAIKSKNNIPMMQPDRILELKEKRIAICNDYLLNIEFANQIFDLIVLECCRIEDEIIADRSI